MRMEEERVPKKVMKGRRPIGRPRGRWLDAVDTDAKWMLNAGIGGQQRIVL
jgi:hypothetical protein